MESGYLEKARFTFLEQRLTWQGIVKRVDLRKHFGLSESGANQVFRAYNRAFPGAMELDRSVKAYVPSAQFRPRFYEPSIEHSPLQLMGSGLSVNIDSAMLLILAKCLRERRTMHIEYRSLDQATTLRAIFPLALIRMIDGFPPALHAWCYLRGAPRTFQLANIGKARAGKVVTVAPVSTEMTTGLINYEGLRIRIPRSAIYAVAGQCFGVPEFRDEKALAAVKQLAKVLTEHWTSGEEESASARSKRAARTPEKQFRTATPARPAPQPKK